MSIRRPGFEAFPPPVSSPYPSRCPNCQRTYTGRARGFRVAPGEPCPSCGTLVVALAPATETEERRDG